MGSKGVKVIVVDPAGGQRPRPADMTGFRQGVQKFNEALQSHPLTGEGLPKYGTNALANVINAAGGYPTRNFSEGQFEGAEPISGERQHDVILERGGEIAHACHRGCTIRCSRIYVDEHGQYLTKGPEYETVWAHGANCGIDDLDAIARMDRMDDDLGLDTIETGATIAVAMEAGILPFGDAAGAMRLLEEVRQGHAAGAADRLRRGSAGQSLRRRARCPRSRASRCRPTIRGPFKASASPTPRRRWAPITRPATR